MHAKTCGGLLKPSPAALHLAAGSPCSPGHAVRAVRQGLDGLLDGCPQLLSSELDLQAVSRIRMGRQPRRSFKGRIVLAQYNLIGKLCRQAAAKVLSQSQLLAL